MTATGINGGGNCYQLLGHILDAFRRALPVGVAADNRALIPESEVGWVALDQDSRSSWFVA